MKIGDLVCLYLILCISFLSVSSKLFNLKQTPKDPKYDAYCKENGGVVLTNVMKFDTKSGEVDGYIAEFCEIESNFNLGMIGLETLASTLPSLAATYIKLLTIDTKKPIIGPYSQPAVNLCQALGGSCINFHHDGGFYDDRGFSGLCYFGDGSHVATWTLYYIGIGGRDDIKNLIRAEPLAINIPVIQ